MYQNGFAKIKDAVKISSKRRFAIAKKCFNVKFKAANYHKMSKPNVLFLHIADDVLKARSYWLHFYIIYSGQWNLMQLQ